VNNETILYCRARVELPLGPIRNNKAGIDLDWPELLRPYAQGDTDLDWFDLDDKVDAGNCSLSITNHESAKVVPDAQVPDAHYDHNDKNDMDGWGGFWHWDKHKHAIGDMNFFSDDSGDGYKGNNNDF
jgi:hypothetical protein